MRKLVCAIVCNVALLVTPVVALGQTAPVQDTRRLEAGVKLGVTSSDLSVTGLPGFAPDAGIGAAGGGWVSVGRESVRFQTEITYGGRRFSSPSPAGDIEVSARVIEVAVLVVGRWRSTTRTRPMLYGGPSFGFLSSVTQTVGSARTNIDSDIKDVDIGAVGGGGLEISAGRGAVVLDARYTHGFRDVSESTVTSFKLRTFMMSFGYRF
jgi:hypothetical protein